MPAYMPQAKSTEWETPLDLFNELDAEFHFTLDPCATAQNTKCAKFYDIHDDGLSKSWMGESVFMNPPYGKGASNWVAKAYFESQYAKVIVALLPVRSDTAWFHDFVYGKAEIRFLRGRVKYIGPDGQVGSATFPSMVVIWRNPARGDRSPAGDRSGRP